MNFERNNLDKAISPYLQQHKDNPVRWQEWSKEVLEYARQNNKLILVSIGYATCHWCHVMARTTFENKSVAELLNKHFIAIKIDREERPDLDQYFSTYSIQTRGMAGWPLNVILTPDKNPLFAFTYLAPTPQMGQPGMLDVLEHTYKWYQENKNKITSYELVVEPPPALEENKLREHIFARYDLTYGGFGSAAKFPPHTTLLFLLNYIAYKKDKSTQEMIERTLDNMATRGLHDHLGGGFFRYCIDRAWTIPHFEKMLYDQALHLWVYSAAYKVLGKPEYKRIAQQIIDCLEQNFEHDGLFYAAVDADTDGKEGATYTWQEDDILKNLTPDEYGQFSQIYDVSEQTQFGGGYHLVKKELKFLDDIEQKLFALRKNKPQPLVDKKIITSWNALTGIGLVMAYRCGVTNALNKAQTVAQQLITKHVKDNKVLHSSINGHVQELGFMQDYASLLLLLTYLYEDTGEYKELINTLSKQLQTMCEKKEQKWIEHKGEDITILAQPLDHPIPSSISLAQQALMRADILQHKDYEEITFKAPLSFDFANITALISAGYFHIIDTPANISWDKLPLNSIQRHGKIYQNCFDDACKKFASENELVKSVNKK